MMTDWDYLIVTASNERQAASYETQLTLRRQLGFLGGCREVLVIPDAAGKRIGSGGSTLHCLATVLSRQLQGRDTYIGQPQLWREVLDRLRILIVHAGGDSRRLPAYSPCGKIFVPMPGQSDSCLPLTLFDRQLPIYLALPRPEGSGGQIVITSGDVLLGFDPSGVRFHADGITGLGAYAAPEQASRHGVFCLGREGRTRLFLQKPSPAEQEAAHAIDAHGRAVLDIGVMNLSARTAVELLKVFGAKVTDGAQFTFSDALGQGIPEYGLDFYREICCALGDDVTCADYVRSVTGSGSPWGESLLELIFQGIGDIPLYLDVLPSCEFLHFGTSRQLISSGNYVVQQDNKCPTTNTILSPNTEQVGPKARISGSEAWVEGCSIRDRLDLTGPNVLVGLDVDEPLSLPSGLCIDVVPGRTRDGQETCFVRIYDIDDTFNEPKIEKATYCRRRLTEWLEAVHMPLEDLWPESVPTVQRTMWNARLFPAVPDATGYRRWLWLADPHGAKASEHQAWRESDRYSLAEMATLSDVDAFHRRRQGIQAESLQSRLNQAFGPDSGLSALEVAYLLDNAEDPVSFLQSLIETARLWYENGQQGGMDCLVFPRVIHTLGTALRYTDSADKHDASALLESLAQRLSDGDRLWLESLGLSLPHSEGPAALARAACGAAFERMGQVIVSSSKSQSVYPTTRLRSDEIVWGRAPARFDTGGGWTDTPPYALEWGGCVVNTAVDLNGQPPIQAYLRVMNEPVIRIHSIDLGTTIQIDALDELLDYRQPDSEYGLAKAALALSGFSPEAAPWPRDLGLPGMLELFGGGIDLTTLAAVPKGSGLGTSSIMGAVLLAVIWRAMGRPYHQGDIFNAVLRLEQLLTTGGGWQDQVGGVVGGSKIISTEPGLLPKARIEYLLPDVLDPAVNGGQTLLYYTGITRLAKGILAQVVGHYLDRDRQTMATLQEIRALAPRVAGAMSRKDLCEFGELVHVAWELNKQLDPGSSNDQVESLMSRIRPHIYGAKLLGAGGGGFLLMVCRSLQHAATIRDMLDKEPPNDRARFFDYQINPCGLVVTAC